MEKSKELSINSMTDLMDYLKTLNHIEKSLQKVIKMIKYRQHMLYYN